MENTYYFKVWYQTNFRIVEATSNIEAIKIFCDHYEYDGFYKKIINVEYLGMFEPLTKKHEPKNNH